MFISRVYQDRQDEIKILQPACKNFRSIHKS